MPRPRREILSELILRALSGPPVWIGFATYRHASNFRWALYSERKRHPGGEGLEVKLIQEADIPKSEARTKFNLLLRKRNEPRIEISQQQEPSL